MVSTSTIFSRRQLDGRLRLTSTIILLPFLATWSVGFQSMMPPHRSPLPQHQQLFRDIDYASDRGLHYYSSPRRRKSIPLLSVSKDERNEEESTTTATLPKRRLSPPHVSSSTVPQQQSTSSSSSSSWIPRLAFLFVCRFRRHWEHQLPLVVDARKSATISSSSSAVEAESTTIDRMILDGSNITLVIDNTNTAQSIDQIALWSIPLGVAQAVVEATLDRQQDLPEVSVQRTDPTLPSDDEDESDVQLSAFFPVPAANGEIPDLESVEQEQVMWNLTQDLSDEDDNEEQLSPERIVGDVEEEQDIVSVSVHSIKEEEVGENEILRSVASMAESLSVVEDSSGDEEELDAPTEISNDQRIEIELNTDDAATDDLVPVVAVESDSNIDKESQQKGELQRNLDHDDLKRRAAEISHSFYAKEFQPAWFAKNPHLQTIAAVKARQESMYFPTTGNLILSKFQWDQRQRVETVDGDFFDVDWKYTQQSANDFNFLASNDDDFSIKSSTAPLVLICHGLQSNTDSPLVKDMATAFNSVGMDVAAINFRGCSGEPNRTPMGYHLSYTDDLDFMVKQISVKQPGRPIYLSGFSLGANVVTNFLANIGAMAAEEYNIWGSAVNAVPFDLVKCQTINEPGFSGAVYGSLLFKSLQSRVLESMETMNYNFTKEELLNCTNCKEFDDLVVCSVYDDFENAEDYHRKSSTYDRLNEIMVPQLIMQALDDPFFVNNTNPENDPTLPCRIQYSKHGGHCGFVFHSEERDKRDSSFMPTELARFMEHVHLARTGQKSTRVARRQQNKPNSITVANRSAPKNLRRQMAADAANSFDAREFVPVDWARNEHLQTIMGALFRRETMYFKNRTSLLGSFLSVDEFDFHWDRRERMQTPDGDFFDVDWKYVSSDKDKDKDNDEITRTPSIDERPVVLICHGLQSNTDSPLTQDMAFAFNNIGMDVAAINFRGCSGEINLTPVGYHLGFTEDLMQMIEYVNTQYPSRRIYLSGFSLGANVVTTCLAELGERAHDYNIFGAAVNAVPFDMPKAQRNLNENGLTKSLYGGRLLASMVDRVEASYHRAGMDFQFPYEEARKCRTIMDMENLLIAPIFGFRDAYDYYEQTSTLPKVDQVAVPELVIQAKDDPFFAGQSLPATDDRSRPLRVQMTDHGGHCGYVFQQTNDNEDEERSRHDKTSWMPTELARFLAHLEETFSSDAPASIL